MTGWGQTGPLADVAGHDINYISLSGVLHAIGTKERPVPPLNVIGDMGGGAMFLAMGLLAGLLEAKNSGQGQVVDIAMTEGSAYLAMACFGLASSGHWKDERESNPLDGGAPFWRCYETKDGKHISLGCVEEKFYNLLMETLDMTRHRCRPSSSRKAGRKSSRCWTPSSRKRRATSGARSWKAPISVLHRS